MRSALMQMILVFPLIVLFVPTVTSAEDETVTNQYIYPVHKNEQLRNDSSATTARRKEKDQTAYDKNIQESKAVEWVEKGLKLDSSGNYGAAIDALSKAIELYPQLAAAYYNRGNTNWELAKHDQAINDYNKAIDIDHEVRIQWFAAI